MNGAPRIPPAGTRQLDAKIPSGPIPEKWDRCRFESKLVNPANRRKFTVIIVGTGLAGGLTASDDSGDPIQMCISNTTTCSLWSAFAPKKSWTLTAGNGTKTVYAWFRDKWGSVNTSPYSDTIILDTIAPVNGTVTPTAGNARVTLNWTGFSDPLSGIAGYKVVYCTVSAPTSCSTGTAIYTGANISYIHTGLTNGTTCYYRVCATDKAGNLSRGATASAKPAKYPSLIKQRPSGTVSRGYLEIKT